MTPTTKAPIPDDIEKAFSGVCDFLGHEGSKDTLRAHIAALEAEKTHLYEEINAQGGWRQRYAALEAEVARCHARLEIDHYFTSKCGDGLTRVEVPMDDRKSMPDGISARDETIKFLEEALTCTKAENKRLREHLATRFSNDWGDCSAAVEHALTQVFTVQRSKILEALAKADGKAGES